MYLNHWIEPLQQYHKQPIAMQVGMRTCRSCQGNMDMWWKNVWAGMLTCHRLLCVFLLLSPVPWRRGGGEKECTCFAIPNRTPHPVCLEVACAAHLQVLWKGLVWSILAVCICLVFLYRILMYSEVKFAVLKAQDSNSAHNVLWGRLWLCKRSFSSFFMACLNFSRKYELCLQIVRWFLIAGLYASYSTPSILLNFSIQGDPIRG